MPKPNYYDEQYDSVYWPLNEDERRFLRTHKQRTQLYFAVFGTFETHVKTKMKDATGSEKIAQSEWKPVLNVGPHRLVFAGETVVFDALDSYKQTFGGRQEQGYGNGSGLPNVDWRIFAGENDNGELVWSSLNQDWRQRQAWQPEGNGIYCLRASCGGAKAYRWIRVMERRGEDDLSVAAVGSLSGSWGEGWSAEVTLQSSELWLTDAGFAKFQCVGLFAEEQWWNEEIAAWETYPIGWCRQDPRLVLVGYVKEGSAEVDWATKQTTVTIETVHGQMSRSMGHKVAIWRGKGPPKDDGSEDDYDPDDGNYAGSELDKRSRKRLRRANRREKRDEDNGSDDWGAILKGQRRVCVTDFALYLLQFKTNLLEWHDFYASWDDDLADLESVAGEEADLLSNLSTVANNDWLVTGCDAASAILFAPDRQVTRDPDWPWAGNRMAFGPRDVLSTSTVEQLEQRVKYVKLVATKNSDGKQVKGNYPDKNPNLNEPGTWLVRQDLLHDSKRVIRRRAEKVFIKENLTWTATLNCGANRAVRPGDYVRVAVNTSGIWNDKKFIVTGVSYDVDVPNCGWLSSIDLEETVDD